MKNKIVLLETEQNSIEIIKSYISEIENVEFNKSFENYQEGVEYIKETL